jgi:sulfite reductase alpha subunit-like flavoprotein
MSVDLDHSIPKSSTSDPDNPIPQEPDAQQIQLPQTHALEIDTDSISSLTANSSSEESSTPTTPISEGHDSDSKDEGSIPGKTRRASTKLISTSPADVRRILAGPGGTQFVGKVCCGGGCCFLNSSEKDSGKLPPIIPPDNEAFKNLNIPLGPLSLESQLTNTVELPEATVALESIKPVDHQSTVKTHPPEFVTPHPPYEVFSSKIYHARELTKPGAEKRTYHFELDVTDYPKESGSVDFVVGGAIGVCAPNSEEVVNDLFTLLGIPSFVRDKPVLLKTSNGRWPTIWGDEQARELVTTRREILTWCSDVQSFPPTKQILRLLAEYADAPNEKKILMFLASAQGQAAFCDLRTGPHVTLSQLLSAFPSSRPPLAHLLSVLNTLMPRFYSLSQDPHVSCMRDGPNGSNCRRLIEIAVTVHETPDWRDGSRTGVSSGFFERIAKKFIEAEQKGTSSKEIDLRIPMFRGLMANPLAKEFSSDGPMLLIGAGVGIAPFRGFVQRRLRSANCANKVWVLQGIRDSLVDELYKGEWGVDDEQVRRVIQSRKGKGRYVQEEVRNQADLVWYIINAVDGRIFVCGSTKGMGEGVESALTDVAMSKGNLNREEAESFWAQKKKEGQYVAVSFPLSV